MSLPFQLEGLSLFAILSLLALLAFAFCLRAPSACLGLVVGFIGALLWSHKAAITAYFVSCFTRLFASAVPHLPSVVSDCFLLGLWQDPFLMMALLWRILEGTINTCACVARFLSPVGIAVAQFVTFFGTMTMPFAYKHFLALAVRAGDRLQTCLWIAVATVVACLSPLLAILVDCVLVPCWEEIIVPTSSVITVWSAAQLQELRKSPTDALVAWLRATSGTASAVLRFLGLMAVGILVLAGSAFTAVAVRITATVLSGYKAAICWTTLRAVPWVCHLTVILMEEPAVASCSTMLAADILEASLGASEVLALVPFLWLAHGDKSAMLASLYRFSETASIE